MEHPIPSLTISFGRGLVLISGCLVVLAFLFGANGIWLSPLVSESLCLLITLFFLIRYFRRVRREASGERDGDTGCQAAGLSLPAAWQNGAWQKAMRRSLSEHSFRQAVQTF